MSSIKLKSSDEVTFVVDRKVARFFGIVKKTLDELPLSGDGGEVFLLPSVNSETLAKIITWATFHSQNNGLPIEDHVVPSLETDSDEETKISGWESEFLKMDVKALYELKAAAETLEIKGLSEITAKAADNLVKEMSVEEIRTMFNIEAEADFTFEEQAQIQMENDWSELFQDEDDA